MDLACPNQQLKRLETRVQRQASGTAAALKFAGESDPWIEQICTQITTRSDSESGLLSPAPGSERRHAVLQLDRQAQRR